MTYVAIYSHQLHEIWNEYALPLRSCTFFCRVNMDTSVLQASFSKSDFRSIIKFHVLLRKTPTEIHAIMAAALGDFCPSYETVRSWSRRISEGKVDVDDEHRSGRPVSASDDQHVEMATRLLEEDRRITTRQLAAELGISANTAHRILTEKLGKRKVAAKWVLHVLTVEQQLCRVNISAVHLKRFRREGESFLQRIIACDETWARAWEPKLKRQSAEWLSPSSPRPTKARREMSSLKVMHITFFDRQGLLFDQAVPCGQTVNGDYYLRVLKKVRRAIRDKRPQMSQEGPILLQDNAAAHRKAAVLTALEDFGWEIMAHPPYSPDLSPCDFFLFPKIKEAMRGQRFKDTEDINEAYRQSLAAVTKSGLQGGIDSLVPRWQKCVDADGAYFESL